MTELKSESAISKRFAEMLMFIEQETGIRLPETAYREAENYLKRKLSLFDGGLQKLFERIQTDPEERADFLDSVTINETYFFREERQFKILDSLLFPGMKKTGKQKITIWSAACSSGEEAVSLGVLAAKHFGLENITIYAGDINPNIIERLHTGTYGKNSFREDGRCFHGLVAEYLSDDGSVVPELKKRISVSRLNLITDTYSDIPDGLDAVFFRNTLIYMPMKTRGEIIGRLADKLSPGGFLFLSSSEIPHMSHPELVLEEFSGSYYFRKRFEEEKRQGITPNRDTIQPKAVSQIKESTSRRITSQFSPQQQGAADGDRVEEQLEQEKSVDVEEMLIHATNRLNNPVYEEEGPSYEAAMLCLEAVFFLNQGEFSQARASVGKIESGYGPNPVTHYLLGMLFAQNNEYLKAAEAYEKSLKLYPRFWPARIKLGLLVKDKKPEKTINLLEKALEHIDVYINDNQFFFQFLLEGFNAKYFSKICGGWVQKLKQEGEGNGA